MRFRTLKITAITGALLAAMSATVYAGNLTEPKTGKSFVDSVKPWDKDWAATGTALRIKSVPVIGKVQVYAMAFYLEKEGGSAALASWKGSDGKIDVSKAQGDTKFYDAIINCECGRGSELVFLRDIDGPKVRDAFLESTGLELQARFGIKADDPSVKADMDKLGEFLNYNVVAGNKLKFYVSKKGSISATGVGGSLVVKNAKVGKALLASWLGSSKRFSEDSTLADLKKNLVGSINNIYNP